MGSAGPFCTPRLRDELNQLSFQALYRVFEFNMRTKDFWHLTLKTFEMLHNIVSHDHLHCSETVTNKCQNLSEEFPHFITDLAPVCFKAFHKIGQDKTLTLLVYQAHYFHILQVEAPNPASAFLHNVIRLSPIHMIIKSIFTLHPLRHRLQFTGQCYALVAEYYMHNYLSFSPRWDFRIRSLYFPH